MSSPYTPPSAPVRDPGVQRGSPLKAVIAGVAVDLGGSLAAGIVLSILYASSLAEEGMDEAQLTAALSTFPLDSWFFISGMIVGGMFSIAGGYVCARIARRSELKLGAIVAVISFVTAMLLAAGTYSTAMNVALSFATVAAVMAGAWLGARRNAAA